MTDQNTTSMSQPTGFAVGDRVRTPTGIACVVHHGDPSGLICVTKDNMYTGYFPARELTLRPPMSQPARMLLAAWHASGRTLERVDRPHGMNRVNVNWGRAVRRYCTPDRSVDITIAVEVQ